MCSILYIHSLDGPRKGLQFAEELFLGDTALQHRGQHGGGFASTNGDRMWVGKFFGAVATQFDPHGARHKPPRPYRDVLGRMCDRTPYKAASHLRYATAGPDDDLAHYQPHYVDDLIDGRVVYLANGDIPKLAMHREKLRSQGVEVFSENDGEFTLRYICYLRRTRKLNWVQAIHQFMQDIPGAYSGILMTKTHTYLLRDPRGFRPCVVGTTSHSLVAASESVALKTLRANFTFEVKRGSVVEIQRDGSYQEHLYPFALPKCAAHCVFCQAYFGRSDSKMFIDERPFDDVRQKGSYAHSFGVELAKEHPAQADFVAAIRNSGDLAAKGYSEQSGIPDKELFIRNFAIPRTFLASLQEERELLVQLKFGIMTDLFTKPKWRRVVVVDDSIVRSTTARGIVQITREAGAEEVHFRSAFPIIIDPCYMGIAMPTRAELIGASRSVDEVRQCIGADSLGYLSLDGLHRTLKSRGDDPRNYCTACITGKYPIPV